MIACCCLFLGCCCCCRVVIYFSTKIIIELNSISVHCFCTLFFLDICLDLDLYYNGVLKEVWIGNASSTQIPIPSAEQFPSHQQCFLSAAMTVMSRHADRVSIVAHSTPARRVPIIDHSTTDVSRSHREAFIVDNLIFSRSVGHLRSCVPVSWIRFAMSRVPGIVPYTHPWT